MKNARLFLKYFAPYKWSAVKNVIYNILSAVFALVSYTLVGPFLKILFDTVHVVNDPGPFRIDFDYLSEFTRYYLYSIMETNGQAGALVLVVIVVIVASLFKNGFIFLANNSMAYIRSCTFRDLRKNM